ncbi:hypothetical protein SAY86_003097 [Trapa natans]|uniref:Uncharacterized protein n=1 Tax=Trapa natans TaxID=22666 RepID=A0AAN7R5B8_TRANT|nr:hypothetical protein SAY86_003097 [Trapa natans]
MGRLLRGISMPSNSISIPTTTSMSVTDTINGSHRFIISGYSLSKGIGIGKYMVSDTFTVGGYQWAIYFYPDGKSPEHNASYVSLFIALVSEGTDVRALFELTLLDQSGRERHKVHSHFRRTLDSGPYTLKYRGSMWGYKRFYQRDILETSDYIKDDCLVVYCSVGVVRSCIKSPKIYSIAVPSSNLGQHLGELLKSGMGADVTFEVNGELFSAHKLVLAARSPVFRAQLYGPIKDQNTRHIRVVDIEVPVFKTNLKVPGKSCSSAVMQTDGFQHLKESCPSLLTELLEYVAGASEQSVIISSQRSESVHNGNDANGRRVKQRF